jgi:hypothetical protein
MFMNEITIFKPNSRAKQATISSPVEKSVVEAFEERMGKEQAAKARAAFSALGRTGGDLLQFKAGSQRIRVRRLEA